MSVLDPNSAFIGTRRDGRECDFCRVRRLLVANSVAVDIRPER